MKILVLIESLKVDQHSGAIVGWNYITALAKSDNDIHVLYPDEVIKDMPNPEPDQIPNVTTERFRIIAPDLYEKIVNRIPKIRAYPAVLFGANFQMQRWISSWEKAIESSLVKHDYDLIIALGIGAVFAPHFAMESVATNTPWMAYIHDPFPFHHYPEPYKTKTTITKEAQYKRFDRVLSKADFVGFPSLRLKEWMEQFHPVLTQKSVISPHVAFAENMNNVLLDEADIKLDPSQFNFLHAGSLLGHRDPSHLIEAFRRFVGDDPEKKAIAHLFILGAISQNHIDIAWNMDRNIHLINKRIEYVRSLRLLAQADVLVLLESVAKESPFMPGKLSDYIKTDRPILALTPKRSETSRLLGMDYPYLAEADDVEKIGLHLESLWLAWKAGELNGLQRPDLQYYISAENLNTIVHDLAGVSV